MQKQKNMNNNVKHKIKQEVRHHYLIMPMLMLVENIMLRGQNPVENGKNGQNGVSIAEKQWAHTLNWLVTQTGALDAEES